METWKPVPGYEGEYEVSSKGRVRSLARRIPFTYRKGHASSKPVKPRILQHYVHLCRQGTGEMISVRKLVAQVFH